MIYESIINRRTIRKYDQKPIPVNVLRKCVDAARLTPSANNRQFLKYIIVHDQQLLPVVFGTVTSWARGVPNYDHTPREVPTAYIVILQDTRIWEKPGIDAGIAAMAITMVAEEVGVGSCIIGSTDRPKLKQILNIPEHLKILYVMSLGYPAEKATVEDMVGNNRLYWRDEQKTMHVPKRKFDEIVFWNNC